MSFHTRLDAAEGGINDILAETLELQNIQKFEAEEGLDSRFGDLAHEMTFEDFCLFVKEKLGAPSILASKGKDTVSRVAVLGGAGKDAIFSAMATGADAYLTGEASYHGLLDAMEMGFSVLTAGHDFTENAFFAYFKKALNEAFTGLTFEENPVKCALYHI
jgi:dinuclear metal center YbgI/SA1388 family protein